MRAFAQPLCGSGARETLCGIGFPNVWEVVLSGDDADLRSLSESFADGDPAILGRDGEYLFRWSVLDGRPRVS